MAERHYNSRTSIQQRRDLRSALTPPEAILWRVLQRSALQGRKFRRQHGIGPYIVDFYCAGEKLIVELDGASHEGDRVAQRDQARDSFMEARGVTVLRIENRHVIENLEGVLQYIRQHFKNR
jgi:very-short-patch-repair endonuclease